MDGKENKEFSPSVHRIAKEGPWDQIRCRARSSGFKGGRHRQQSIENNMHLPFISFRGHFLTFLILCLRHDSFDIEVHP